MKNPGVILVTGATRGIGFALANELVRKGHTVFGTGRKPPAADQTLFSYIPMISTMSVRSEKELRAF
ncbi:MAG: SDR family NAD(P)-dependent oxidoreductase [Spirochaetales bacterium]|nr:MAG: SDR family NAD(P)-dependent oxidoreductase [Spirochaetales bacterium]